MNNNIPYILAYVRNTYLYNLEDVKGVTECYIFGVKCVLNKPLSFHCQLDNGAVFWGLPISAFVNRRDYASIEGTEASVIDELLWWNCQSSDCDVTTFHYLTGSNATLKTRSGEIQEGSYIFTVDDFVDNRKVNLGYSEDPDSKCFHVFSCYDGWFRAFPNDKIRWFNPNFVDRSLEIPKYKAYQQDLRAEN